MDVVHRRCAGLDVHKDSVVACRRIVRRGRAESEVRTFATTTRGLLELRDWLEAAGCTVVAMESTGVYWKPVWHILEESFELVLANATHVRNVPGRKTDVNDATWIAELLAHGLIRGSFVPPEPIRELRELTRARTQLVREVGRHTQRIQKTLEDANVKLVGLISDTLGVTGRRILRRLIVDGSVDIDEVLAGRKPGRPLKASREQLREALEGRITENHRYLLRLHLGQVEALEAAIADLEVRIGQIADPFRPEVDRLLTMPGVSKVVALILLAEIGPDMSRFPSAGHLRSWAGLCPRNDESAGKRRSNRLRKGDAWLKSALVQAAWAAIRTKDSYFRGQFYRIRARRGAKKAIVAVAASMLTAAHAILSRGVPYRELGSQFFDRIDSERTVRRLSKRLENLGYSVSLAPKPNPEGQNQATAS